MKMIVYALGIFFLAGCVSVPPSSRDTLTAAMAKTKIEKGVTTQNEILETFGSPNIITKNKSGNEVWTYDKMSIERSLEDDYGTLIILGGTSSRATTQSRTFTLMIEFDENDIVKDYSYRTSSF